MAFPGVTCVNLYIPITKPISNFACCQNNQGALTILAAYSVKCILDMFRVLYDL